MTGNNEDKETNETRVYIGNPEGDWIEIREAHLPPREDNEEWVLEVIDRRDDNIYQLTGAKDELLSFLKEKNSDYYMRNLYPLSFWPAFNVRRTQNV